ncbi:Ger(x)C family spore germination protein [Paenibacillus psychroresistens]|uniref:Ger(X)C family spore germination protein n=1 Tax=Paenibacillus psychroresistens TaxID=1778678 RepID=A0A6B8RMU2_9BACL|nr:Ger(x)C family spore germination protein [Paenibacillus psychroresistens]QGQ97620.1 Ger(x)C family spore germination protein [Paenibacillus psychroresistens]
MTSSDKRKRWIPCVLMIALALTSCSSERIVDHINIVTILGLDKNDAGFKETGLYSDFNHAGRTALLQGNAKKPSLLLDEMNNQSSQPVAISKLKLLIINKQLAEEGITLFIESICKDPLISHYMIVAISDGAASSMLESLVDLKSENLPNYTIEHNIRSGAIPESNLHTLLFDYYGEGRDPSVPYLKLNQKGKIVITGQAIFKDDRLKLIINQEEVAMYKMLQGHLLRGNVPFTIMLGQNEGTAVFNSLGGKKSQALSKSARAPKVIYNITMNGMIKDYPKWANLRKTGNDRLLIMQLEKQVRNKLLALLNKFVKNNVDPLGVGDLVRAHSKVWNEKEFYEVEYPNIKFEVHVNVNLMKSGIVE